MQCAPCDRLYNPQAIHKVSSLGEVTGINLGTFLVYETTTLFFKFTSTRSLRSLAETSALSVLIVICEDKKQPSLKWIAFTFWFLDTFASLQRRHSNVCIGGYIFALYITPCILMLVASCTLKWKGTLRNKINSLTAEDLEPKTVFRVTSVHFQCDRFYVVK